MMISGTTSRVEFEVPETWERVDELPPSVEAIAVQPGPEGTFAPNAVLTLNEYSGGIAEFAARASGGLWESLDDVYVIDVQPWNPTVRGDVELPGGGRVISYTHRSPRTGARIRAAEWLMVGNGLAVQLTTSAGVGQWPVFGPMFEEIASTLRFSKDPAGRVHEEPALPPEARDELASQLQGVELPRFSGIHEAQPYPFGQGTWVRESSIELLAQIAESGSLGDLVKAGMHDELEELAALELVEDSTLTESGQGLAQLLLGAVARLRIEGKGRAENGSVLQVFLTDNAGLFLASGDDGEGCPGEGFTNLIMVPLGDVTTMIGRWTELEPAWQFDVEPRTVALAAIEGREEEGAPVGLPDGANDAMTALWSQPWFRWHLSSENSRGQYGPFMFLNGGQMGTFGYTLQEQGLVLESLSSSQIFDDLEEILQAVTFGRDPILERETF